MCYLKRIGNITCRNTHFRLNNFNSLDFNYTNDVSVSLSYVVKKKLVFCNVKYTSIVFRAVLESLYKVMHNANIL